MALPARFALGIRVLVLLSASALSAGPDADIPVHGFYEGPEVCTEVVNRAVADLLESAKQKCPKGYRETGPERNTKQVYDPSKTPLFGTCQESPDSDVRSYRIEMTVQCKG